MAISKIIVNGVTKMDVTGNTNTAETIATGYIGTGADGQSITGTFSGGGVNYYTGSTVPTNNLGSDGDIYVIV